MIEDPRILTVDDSPSMRALLKNALSGHRFSVFQADDGQAALEWLALHEVDLVIPDINMPRLDGFGLIEQLRSDRRHSDRPILVLTTENSHEKRARARASGATGWIVKPFNSGELVAAVRRAIH